MRARREKEYLSIMDILTALAALTKFNPATKLKMLGRLIIAKLKF
jgi:hypothetical protein